MNSSFPGAPHRAARSSRSWIGFAFLLEIVAPFDPHSTLASKVDLDQLRDPATKERNRYLGVVVIPGRNQRKLRFGRWERERMAGRKRGRNYTDCQCSQFDMPR